MEHLPLPMDDGKPIILERNVIGVAGGFVVPGYRLGRRGADSLRLSVSNLYRASDGAVVPTNVWTYFRDLHAIEMHPPRGEDGPYVSVDLGRPARKRRRDRSVRCRAAPASSRIGSWLSRCGHPPASPGST